MGTRMGCLLGLGVMAWMLVAVPSPATAEVFVLRSGERVEGTLHMEFEGELLIRLPDGAIRRLQAADVVTIEGEEPAPADPVEETPEPPPEPVQPETGYPPIDPPPTEEQALPRLVMAPLSLNVVRFSFGDPDRMVGVARLVFRLEEGVGQWRLEERWQVGNGEREGHTHVVSLDDSGQVTAAQVVREGRLAGQLNVRREAGGLRIGEKRLLEGASIRYELDVVLEVLLAYAEQPGLVPEAVTETVFHPWSITLQERTYRVTVNDQWLVPGTEARRPVVRVESEGRGGKRVFLFDRDNLLHQGEEDNGTMEVHFALLRYEDHRRRLAHQAVGSD